MWKKKIRTETVSSSEFSKIHKAKEASEVSTPCIGGTIVWVSVFAVVLLFYLISLIFPQNAFWGGLNFFSRSQTLLPLGVFFLGAILGLFDDLLEITGRSNITRDSSWYTKLKLSIIVLIGATAGWWFYTKLGMDAIHLPWGGLLYLGIWFVPFVVIIMLATFSGGVIDGIDGLSGGVLSAIFAAYSVIAYADNQIDLAALSLVISGATLAFLWFNIPPARFYMGETGMMPLTIVLATFAFLTDTVLLLPIIALPLAVTSFSSSSQLIAKKFGKKIFKVAPLHHHFEALGWPSYKVTMRYWVLSVMFAIIGVILAIMTK
jgi:phospho-N-acetylmuramoyl-pentapeptide-transferase